MIGKILEILENSKKIVEEWDNTSFDYHLKEYYDTDLSSDNSCIFYGDNMNIMKYLEDDYSEKIDLIYIDPPFASKANYSTKVKLKNKSDEYITFDSQVYTDNWKEDILGYLKMLTPRLFIMKKLLSQQGSIYVHVDWHASHYVKLILDEVFGRENFINEIIWNYKSGGASKKRFSRKHDTIFLYSKTENYIFNAKKEKSYNRGYKKYGFKGVREYSDENGWYTLVNMKDTWDIDMVGRTSKERVEYATQKPLKLLERIIEVSSSENSIIADFFSGSGTTALAAANLNRKCLSADSSKKSISTIQKRLLDNNISYSYFEAENDINENNFKLKFRLEDSVIKIDNITYQNVDKLPIKKKERELFMQLLPFNKDKIIDRILACQMREDKVQILGLADKKSENSRTNNIFKIVDMFGNYIYVKSPLA